MEVNQVSILWNKYKAGTITSEEWDMLRGEIAKQPYNEMLEEDFMSLIHDNGATNYWTEEIEAKIWQVVKDVAVPVTDSPKVLKLTWVRYAAAALILFVGVAAYFIINQPKDTQDITRVEVNADLPPGGNKAILVLSDGSKISLEDAINGQLAKQGTSEVVKLDDGSIGYTLASPNAANESLKNTMITPKGGQYQLVLPDGSKAWLNASSSITYPVAFSGSQRAVTIKGEVYFEIKAGRTPFVVNAGNQLVEVLGTSFNINSYEDEIGVATTLLEGRVKVVNKNSARSDSHLLKPGQQALLTYNVEKISVVQADISKVMAWKNGLFNFSGADLKTVMRQISRWYDVQIVYEGAPPVKVFEGEIQRELHLSEVLDVLKRAGVPLTVKGRQIIISENKD